MRKFVVLFVFANMNTYINRKRIELLARQLIPINMVDIPTDIVKAVPKEIKTYSIYIEVIANGTDEESILGAVEDILDDNFGAENYYRHEFHELTEKEIDQLVSGQDEADDLDERFEEMTSNEGV